jgi:hypothetical protein
MNPDVMARELRTIGKSETAGLVDRMALVAGREPIVNVSSTVAKPWVWLAQKGPITLDKMALSHVFNAFRMVFNALVPNEDKLPGVKVWALDRLHKHAGPDYLRGAVNRFAARLAVEWGELTADQQKQIMLMRATLARHRLWEGNDET